MVDLLIDAGVPVRALTHRSEMTTTLPADVEVVHGDLTLPESLDASLEGVSAVFLVWTAPPESAPAVVERLASHAERVVFLSAPHKTPHPFFQQPNPMAELYADIERRIEDAGLEWTFIRPGMFASNALSWWATAIRTDGVVRWPYGAAETAPVDDRDVAAVAALTLYQDGYAGATTSSPARSRSVRRSRCASSVTSWGVGSDSRNSRRRSSGAKRKEAGRARPWTCCSLRGAQRWEGRRSSPLPCPTSSDRPRDPSASGSPITPMRSWRPIGSQRAHNLRWTARAGRPDRCRISWRCP